MSDHQFQALIVEDDPSWQGILSEILQDYGLQVDCTDHLEGAINRLRATAYRLAIVDLSLAGKDHHNQEGLQILAAAKRFAPGCSTVLLTGHASVEIAIAAIQEYGALTCLQKEHFRRTEFREVVQQALASPYAYKSEPAEKNPSVSTAKNAPEKQGAESLALVIEDDAGWQNLLSELLIDAGYQVELCTSYGEALGLLKREQFQLAVADISLASSLEPERNQDGFRLLNSTRQAKIPTIVVSGFADPDLIDAAYAEQKVFAFFEKQSFVRKAFMETIYNAGKQNLPMHNLTNRELEVLSLLALGLGNKEIAARLFITTNTVKRHLKSIYPKLGVNTRAAASAMAIRLGLSAHTSS